MKTTTKRDETKRARLVAQLQKKCARLYDSATPASVRSDLSLEVSFLRARLGGIDIENLSRASASDEEC